MSTIPTIHGFDLPNPKTCANRMIKTGIKFDYGGALKYILLVVFTAGITAFVDLILWGVQKISLSLLSGRISDLKKQAENLQENGNPTPVQQSSISNSTDQLKNPINTPKYQSSNSSMLKMFNQILRDLKEAAAEIKAGAKKT